MKHALMEQHVPDEDVPGFIHSARHSVSSYGHDSPATPHTAQGEDFDDRFKMPPTGETPLSKVDAWFDLYLTYDDEPDMRQHTVPKFERTYTDAAVDNFYDPTVMMVQTQSIPHTKPSAGSSLLSPYRGSNHNDIVHRTLQAAQKDLPDLESDLSVGNFQGLRKWLNEKVHSKGSLYASGDELMTAATGGPLDVSVFLIQSCAPVLLISNFASDTFLVSIRFGSV